MSSLLTENDTGFHLKIGKILDRFPENSAHHSNDLRSNLQAKNLGVA